MQNNEQPDRLSWGDTVFLHLERDGMPLNVASVCMFEGRISLGDCVQFIESKLPLLPRYLKRLVFAPLGLGLPTWEYDPDFDIHRHVREVTLKHGTDAELKTLAGKLFSQVMDRKHPLWDTTLVHGLKGDRTAVVFRLHHCLADGIAGVGLLNVLLDATPEAPRLPKRKRKPEFPSQRDSLNCLTGSLVDAYSDFVKRLLSISADVLNLAEEVAASGGNLATEELFQLLPEAATSTERLRFNVIYRGPQKFTWTEVPLSEVKTIRQTFGASVNDVVLSLVTATIRRYLRLHGDPVKGKLLRMMVPVNLRGNSGAGELGNCISLVPVTVPLDIRSPRRLLAAVHRRTEFLKSVHAAELVKLSGGLLGMLPLGLQALVGPVLSQLPITPFNLVCTNVPGPQFPLYLLGHKMVRCYPYVPVGGEMAVNCAILSYHGTLYFGFSGDVHAAPDLQRLEKFLKLSFSELREAAGIKRTAETALRKPTRRINAKTETPSSQPTARGFSPGIVEAPARQPIPKSKLMPQTQSGLSNLHGLP
jgi:diacylglycerol O-acyltransferase